MSGDAADAPFKCYTVTLCKHSSVSSPGANLRDHKMATREEAQKIRLL